MPDKLHKLAAIVFTDIAGYTSKMEESEPQTLLLLEKQRELLFPIIREHGGTVVKELGDGLLLMFDSAVDAVKCSISIQTRLKNEDLSLRAGIHIGDVICKDGDVFGSAVNAAARIQALAPLNGVCISEEVKNQIHNKGFTMHSLGKKELKGIREPLEIYELFIEGISQPHSTTFRNVLHEIWRRRVPVVIAVYLAASWILKTAIAYFVNKYLYSPYLVELAWVFLLSMLPAVFMLAYFHSSKRSHGWSKTELIGLPANVVFSLVLAVLMFKGKDLGAATTSVSTYDESGKKIERTFLKNEFRKKTLLFFFENKTGDTSLNWISYAITNLIEYDLTQDYYVEAHNGLRYIPKMSEAGFASGLGTPLTLKKKIAGNAFLNTFLTGSFTHNNGKFDIICQLYDTQTGKLIQENPFSGNNIFTLADELTLKLKTDLGIPEQHLKETPDVAISEIYTPSFKALEYFTRGYLEISIRNDWNKGVQYTELALKEDPGFVTAHHTMSQFYFSNNQVEKSMVSLDQTMKNLYKLPERQQFYAKYFYYILREEADKAHAVVKMWADLYPGDLDAHLMMASIWYKKNETEKAIREYKIIQNLDPSRYDAIRVLGELYKKKGLYDSAGYYLSEYSKQVPQDFRAYSGLGDLYVEMTEFSKAREAFEKALILESENIAVRLDLADLEMREGNPDNAAKIYQEALDLSKTSRDSAAVYLKQIDFFNFIGQPSRAFASYQLGIQKFARYNAPKEVTIQEIFNIDKYVLAGKNDEALNMLKRARTALQGPLAKATAFGYMFYYVETEDAAEAEKYIPDALEVITGFGEDFLLGNIYYAKGKIAEIRKDYKSAIEYYNDFKTMLPASFPVYQWIARSYREAGETGKARDEILKALRLHPFDPENNLEAALIFVKSKDRKKASEHLNKALKIWKNAEPDYKPYQKALELSARVI